MKQYRTFLWFLVPLVLALVAIAERFRFLQISAANFPVTSDEALAKLKAVAIADGERPLLFWGTPYQFPLESYLLSGIVDWLPSTAFGARVALAFIALMSVGGFLFLTRLAFPAGSRWPVLLLVLFPSAYVFTLQSAYFIPQHTMTMAFFLLLPISVIMSKRSERLGLLWTGVTGLLGGIALSTHLLSLPIVAASFLVVCFAGAFRSAAWRVAVLVPAFSLGLLPYLLTYGEAAEVAAAVTGRYSILEALQRFFSPVLWKNLVALLGFEVVLFPEPMRVHWGGYVPALVIPLLLGFWMLLAYATFLSARRIFFEMKNKKRLQLSVDDLFVAAVWASLLAFCLSTRAHHQDYRYLLPAAWGFPFILGIVYAASNTRVRYVLGVLTVSLVSLNVAHARVVMEKWQVPGAVAKAADMYDIDGLIAYLDEQEIDTCYASFWFAYRITYQTAGRITCDQAVNERFAGWPLPFKDDFDLDERAAIILNNRPTSRLHATRFIRMLRWHRAEATMTRVDPYFVFHDFRYKDVGKSRLLDEKNLSLRFDGVASPDLAVLTDGDRLSTWESPTVPDPGSTIEVLLDQPRLLHRVRIFFKRGEITTAPKYRLEVASREGEWSAIRTEIKPTADRLKIDARHTRFAQDYRQDISFPPVEATAVRLVVEQPRGDVPWSISELMFSEDASRSPES